MSFAVWFDEEVILLSLYPFQQKNSRRLIKRLFAKKSISEDFSSASRGHNLTCLQWVTIMPEVAPLALNENLITNGSHWENMANNG